MKQKDLIDKLVDKAGEDILGEDSDSGVLCSETGQWRKDVNAPVSGAICRLGTQEKEEGIEKLETNLYSTQSNVVLRPDPSDPSPKRVYLNHRSVTRLKDIKYKRISKTKSKSMEELRDKLRQEEHC